MPAPAVPANWEDWPRSPGDWSYRQDGRGSIALFGKPGHNADVMLRCDSARRSLYLSVAARTTTTQQADLSIRTSSMRKSLTLRSTGEAPYMAVELAPRDPLLDAMAFSRGKFVLAMDARTWFTVPPWAELSRVIEDCRG